MRIRHTRTKNMEIQLLAILIIPYIDGSDSETICEEEWKELSGSCYYFSDHDSNVETNFSGALSICNSMNASLTSIPNNATNNFLHNNRPRKNTEYWIGLQRSNGRWEWLDGTDYSWQNWDGGKPNKGKEHNFGRMIKEESKWKSSNKQDEKRPYMCRKEHMTHIDTTTTSISTGLSGSQSVGSSADVTPSGTKPLLLTSTDMNDIHTDTHSFTRQTTNVEQDTLASQPTSNPKDDWSTITTESQISNVSDTGLYIGLGVTAVALIGGVLGAMLFIWWRRRKRETKSPPHKTESTSSLSGSRPPDVLSHDYYNIDAVRGDPQKGEEAEYYNTGAAMEMGKVARTGDYMYALGLDNVTHAPNHVATPTGDIYAVVDKPGGNDTTLVDNTVYSETGNGNDAGEEDTTLVDNTVYSETGNGYDAGEEDTTLVDNTVYSETGSGNDAGEEDTTLGDNTVNSETGNDDTRDSVYDTTLVDNSVYN